MDQYIHAATRHVPWNKGKLVGQKALLLGHTKLESTVRYLGIEVDDALEMAEQTEV
jgi:hypothetical protein